MSKKDREDRLRKKSREKKSDPMYIELARREEVLAKKEENLQRLELFYQRQQKKDRQKSAYKVGLVTQLNMKMLKGNEIA